MKSSYNSDFFKDKSSGAINSAGAIIPILLKYFEANSVVDVGCANGTWLSVFKELGAKKVTGYDGNWVSNDDLLITEEEFIRVNLEKPELINAKADLAVSLEVAEHITAAKADRLVQKLCEIAPVIIFSAAIPGQGGTNHINERWQTYWIEKFNSYGYQALDIIRGQIWNNVQVEEWYRQNIFVFVEDSIVDERPDLISVEKEVKSSIYDLVHPETFSKAIKDYENFERISLRSLFRHMPRILLKKISFLLKNKL